MNNLNEDAYEIRGDLIQTERMEYYEVYKVEPNQKGILKFKVGRLISDYSIKEGNFGIFEDEENLLNGIGRCISEYAVEQGQF